MSERVEIVRLAARGDGVTVDGRFVPGAVTGDQMNGDAIEAGPNHVAPPCRHFPECGGCQLQHVGDDLYRNWAAERIVAALAAAGVDASAVEPTHLSPPRSRRRASLRAVRRGGRALLGFNAERSHQLVDMRECHILRPELFALVAPLRRLLAAALGDGQGGGVTMALTDTGVDLLLSNVRAESLAEIERLTDFAAAHDLARLSIEGSDGVMTMVEARAPVLRMGGVPVRPPPAAFLQATADGEAALVAAVLAATAGARRVADLFCGLGTFALPLAEAGAAVVAIDAAGAAIAALAATGRVATQHRDLFRRPLTAAELAGFDAVVLDPPRAGAAAQTAELAGSAVPRVIAVSCNPNTFARDARTLIDGGYRLQRLWPVGQFRWSNHVELVASFVR